MTLYPREGNQPRLRAKGLNPASITLVFQDITNWKKMNGTHQWSRAAFKDRDRKVGDAEPGRTRLRRGYGTASTKTHRFSDENCNHRSQGFEALRSAVIDRR